MFTGVRTRIDLGHGPITLGHRCSTHRDCQLSDPHAYCNAQQRCDCAQPQAACGADRTGCPTGTFQCRSTGVCISWYFVCDGRPDCDDASDEECTVKRTAETTTPTGLNTASSGSGASAICPREAFHCRMSDRCVSRAALCDGKRQCAHGEDEIGCSALKTGR